MDRREFLLSGAATLSAGVALGTNAFAHQSAPIAFDVQHASFDLGKGITHGWFPPPTMRRRLCCDCAKTKPLVFG